MRKKEMLIRIENLERNCRLLLEKVEPYIGEVYVVEYVLMRAAEAGHFEKFKESDVEDKHAGGLKRKGVWYPSDSYFLYKNKYNDKCRKEIEERFAN